MRTLFIVACAAVSALSASIAQAGEVNVYSARKEALIKPLLDRFEQQTGHEVNLVTGKADALITRLASEGKFSPADVLITTDVGRLVRAKQQGLTQAVESEKLVSHIPARLRDEGSHWFGLTLRARPIIYAPDRVEVTSLSNLDGLTDKQWKGRICIRSSSNIYNQSMIAAMIEKQGVEKTQAWAQAFVKNFARPPKGGDRDQIKAVAAGQCDIAIANTYYLGGMMAAPDAASRDAASKVTVFWPDQAGSGAHVNISGAAVTRYASNPQAAKDLLEFMVSAESQQWYAKTNHEYPVVEGVEVSEILTGFGEFNAEQITLSRVGELNAEAVKLMDRAGWK